MNIIEMTRPFEAMGIYLTYPLIDKVSVEISTKLFALYRSTLN